MSQIYAEMEEYELGLELVGKLLDEYQIVAANASALEIYRRQLDPGGVLRAGGDTRFGLILEGSALWVGSILMGWIGAFILHLPVRTVFALLMLDEFIKLPFAAWRYRSKVWLKDVTR